MLSDSGMVEWLTHVLANDVGHAEWVEKTGEELAAYRESPPESMRASAYPLKTITHPIPPGLDIVLENGSYVVACNNLRIRDGLIGLAQRYKACQRERARLSIDGDPWKSASEWPDDQCSSVRKRPVLVASPVLLYVQPVAYGYHDNADDAWYVCLAGKTIRHSVTHWRHVPISPVDHNDYESVRADVESLKRLIKSPAE